MGPTGEVYRVLQIHPTRRCNLRCLHCYSSSGPREREQLDPNLLLQAIGDAGIEGYTVAGFSGGEPLLYKPLRRLLERAHDCGMITTVTSNGMLLDQRRLEVLAGAADLLAISLDGIPSSHNRMRAHDRAFELMARRLEGVRESGIPFGFIFTLTQHNLNELDWVARFALEQGAKLLQIHPLEIVGRAEEEIPEAKPDEIEAAYAYLETQRIQAMAGDRLLVQLDLVHRDALRANPDRVFAGEDSVEIELLKLSELVSPLVIEADGGVVPIQHGFDRAYAVGNLHDAPLQILSNRWKQELYPAFRERCRAVFAEVTSPAPLPFLNWYDAIGGRAPFDQPAALRQPVRN